MAHYDRDASAASTVTAFLAQFSISATGDVRYVSGANTFHIWWLHRALQKKAWDFAVSGDDYINLAKPNPSTSEALGTIITLLDHSTDFSVRYNIDDAAAEYLFGGSIEQQNASDEKERYSGLIVLGSVNNTATTLQMVQNAALVTEFWGDVATGWNQTDSSTLLRILVKTYVADAEVDGSRVNVKASHWGDTYAIWETTLGLGEKVAAINTFSDPQNDTLLATVQAYGDNSAEAEGIDLIDVDGNGDKLFLGTWSYAALSVNTKKALYERVKSFLVESTSETVWGLDGDLFTGRIYDVVLTAGTGGEDWVQNETVTWTGTSAGEGQILGFLQAADDGANRLIIHISKGVPPLDISTLTGAAAEQGSNGDATKITTSPSILGVFTGSAWIAAYGIGVKADELTFGDSVTSLDGEQPAVPQNVTLTVNMTVGVNTDRPHVFLAEKDGVLNAPDYDKYAGTTQTSGAGIVVTGTAIDADEPQTGWVGVLHTGNTSYTFYEYSSWTGSTFTLVGTIDDDVVIADPIFIAFLYDVDDQDTLTPSVSRTFVFDAGTRDFVGWVRHGDPAAPDKPVPISFTGVGSNSTSVTVVLDDES